MYTDPYRRDFHEYHIRARDIRRMHQHRLALYEQLPSKVCVKIIIYLSRQLKDLGNPILVRSQIQQASLI